jgi:DNA-binding transcriptional LysR family regulator
MDRILAMRLLVEVSDSGSFSRASERLNIPVSTVSRKITELENLVGTRFLVRTTRKIALTDAGRSYVEACRDILDRVSTAERVAAGEFAVPKGTLAITSPVMLGQRFIAPVLIEFLERFSNISAHLTLSDRNAQIVEEGFDLAVRIGDLPDSSLTALRIGETRRVICVSPSLLRSHKPPRRPEDLLKLPCVAHDFSVSAVRWSFRDPGRKAPQGILVEPRLSVSTAEAAADAAVRGAGFARLFCYQVADAVKRGDLCLVLQDFELDPKPINLLFSPGRAVPAKIRSFIDFATPKLRDELSNIAVQ